MKILHIISGLGDGGAEAVLYHLISNDSLNYHQVVSLGGIGKYGKLLVDKDISVLSLNLDRLTFYPCLFFRFSHFIISFKPDVIQSWMYHANLFSVFIGVIFRIPICWGIHNSTLHPSCTSFTTIAISRACGLCSWFLPQRTIVCASSSAKLHSSYGYNPSPMIVIPNGYDFTKYSPNATLRLDLRSSLCLPDSIPVLGMVARFDPCKDHANLFDALSILLTFDLDFRLILVGNCITEQNHELLRLLESKHLYSRCLLLGQRSDIPAIMNAIDLSVLSSYSEAFPNVLAESMACGTPCVTTDVGDASEIVGKTGWIVPPRSSRFLAFAIRDAFIQLGSCDSWLVRKADCRKRISATYSLQRMTQSYIDVWRSACLK